MKHIILLFGFFVLSQNAFSQIGKKIKKVEIASSIQCEMCIDRLENSFADFWAVKSVDYDLKEQEIVVTYNSRKTNGNAIRKHISKVGYDADHVASDPESYKKLPACCKKGAHIPEKDKN